MHAPNNAAPRVDRRRGAEANPGFVEFVCLVAMMMAVTAFAVDNMLPALPAIGRDFGTSDPNRLQLVVYVYTLGFGLAQLIYGPASDIYGRRPAFLAGLAVYCLGTILGFLAADLPSLLAARFIQGTGSAAGRVLAVAIVRDRFAGREMSRVMSLTMMVFIMVPIFAPAIGVGILAVGHWHLIFGMMLALGLALGGWFYLRMPETLAPQNQMPFSAGRIVGGLRMTVTSRASVGYATAFGLMFGCIMGMVGSSQQVFAEAYGLGPWFPAAFGSIAAVMGLASLVNSRFVRRWGMHKISHTAMLALLALACVNVVGAALFRGMPPLPLLWIGLAGSQFLLSLCMPNFNALAMEPLGKVAGTASSLIGLYTTVLGALLGLLVGQSYDGTVLPLSIGYLMLAGGVVAVVTYTERGHLFRSRHPDPTPHPEDGSAA